MSQRIIRVALLACLTFGSLVRENLAVQAGGPRKSAPAESEKEKVKKAGGDQVTRKSVPKPDQNAAVSKLDEKQQQEAAKDQTGNNKPKNEVSPAQKSCDLASVKPDSVSVREYKRVFKVMTWLLVLLFLVIVVSLLVSMIQGKWSLGDALSEESGYQQKEIQKKDDVKMVASSSRLIALLGLLGILTIVLGVGYSIIWNLFVCGNVPDLAGVRSFLLGAATLFAPYLANQLREIFSPSIPSGGQPQATGGGGGAAAPSPAVPSPTTPPAAVPPTVVAPAVGAVGPAGPGAGPGTH